MPSLELMGGLAGKEEPGFTVWVFAAGVWAGQETVLRIGLGTSANTVHRRRGISLRGHSDF